MRYIDINNNIEDIDIFRIENKEYFVSLYFVIKLSTCNFVLGIVLLLSIIAVAFFLLFLQVEFVH